MSLSDLYRKDFNIFNAPENQGVIYLDNAATSQRPKCVIDAIADFYNKDNANPLRGLYGLSVRATDDYENARAVVGQFINAAQPEEIVFTRNASESLNLVAYTYAMQNIKAGDEVVISCMEHHSNILPWQMVCKEKNARLVWLECDDQAIISRRIRKQDYCKNKDCFHCTGKQCFWHYKPRKGNCRLCT